MGSCLSTGNKAVDPPPTAKVITVAGALREYAAPVAASDVLRGAACILCSSDRLYLGEYIPAVQPEELLEPGQLYFVLPAAKLRHTLSGEEMAALAVKAGAALGLFSDENGRRSRKMRISPSPGTEDEDDRTSGGDAGGIHRAKPSDEKAGRGPRPVSAQRKMMERRGSIRSRAAYRNFYGPFSKEKLSAIAE